MQLFYNPDIDQETITFCFDKEESKHIIKVLRKKLNDILYVTNGKGFLFECEIILESESKCTVNINDCKEISPKKYKIHLAVAPTKMNERFEWFLEKATEIGIDEITPIICDHSERKIIKNDRFEKIILAAMKQSNQYYLPKLNAAIPLKTFLKQTFEGQKYIAHCENDQKNTLKSVMKSNHNILMLIGPEGDFSTSEIQAALAENFVPVSLGNTRLRTETAAIVACHSIVYHNE
ncbi:16S rRNA (uracil(1498)-N(3))-methyltransferase [Flavobacterium branchiophilum NBRC 15030 = ATCC 35035]|uniref:Ribosomal RNA small subunit methyltransferase E n=1 Tax=Flavobacterium branchiophilum TaxID=55197 RepID=A0A543G732_9FLAO|nr:16S rRNA (uracil(1498)-N(3))-methyltransferase [Flavobacterium branchiophilum]OXA81795.1 16S rRNA (uracil(1498)-N(3))-methyltransferase [Flavobacterium branchiophilum NBRC 15030 = ATCC 35035]TQM41896.1 16S rRNA (uracil1498-N3)-methyltransferase [Flavobacterium branchiophilum]GEM54342.1 ribosomal RNA small subunit methyltransferase E [Flavobacterium branchiophilum NBRC 15030 = ATCC 35035]